MCYLMAGSCLRYRKLPPPQTPPTCHVICCNALTSSSCMRYYFLARKPPILTNCHGTSMSKVTVSCYISVTLFSVYLLIKCVVCTGGVEAIRRAVRHAARTQLHVPLRRPHHTAQPVEGDARAAPQGVHACAEAQRAPPQCRPRQTQRVCCRAFPAPDTYPSPLFRTLAVSYSH